MVLTKNNKIEKTDNFKGTENKAEVDVQSTIQSFTLNERLFILTSLAVLFPFWVAGPMAVGVSLYLMVKNYRQFSTQIQSNPWLFVFNALTALTALYYRNYFGVGVALLLFIYINLFYFYKSNVTARLYLLNLKIFAWGSIPLSILSFIQYARDVWANGYDLFYIFKYFNPQTRAEATLFNPNYYGLFIAMVIVIAIYLVYKSSSPWSKMLSILSIVFNLMALILTGSRWAIPTVIVGVVVMVFFLKPKLAWGLGVFFAALLALLVLRPDLLPRFSTLAYGFADRIGIWQVGWQLFLTSPMVGRGPLSYINFYYLFVDVGKMHSHQLIIDSLANYGIVGVMLLIASFSQYFRSLWRHIFRKDIRAELGLVVAMITTIFFHGLMDVGVFWVQMGYIFLVIVLVTPKLMEEVTKSDIN